MLTFDKYLYADINNQSIIITKKLYYTITFLLELTTACITHIQSHICKFLDGLFEDNKFSILKLKMHQFHLMKTIIWCKIIFISCANSQYALPFLQIHHYL
jgi:hypothetical protein